MVDSFQSDLISKLAANENLKLQGVMFTTY